MKNEKHLLLLLLAAAAKNGTELSGWNGNTTL